MIRNAGLLCFVCLGWVLVFGYCFDCGVSVYGYITGDCLEVSCAFVILVVFCGCFYGCGCLWVDCL